MISRIHILRLTDFRSYAGAELATGGATVLDSTLVLDPTDAGVQYVLMPLRA